MRTYFLGLRVGVLLQFAQKGVLLGQQNFNVLHAHLDYPGADVWLKRVDALVGKREREEGGRGVREEADSHSTNVTIQILSTHTRRTTRIHSQV